MHIILSVNYASTKWGKNTTFLFHKNHWKIKIKKDRDQLYYRDQLY